MLSVMPRMITHALSANGAKVYIVGRREEELKKVAELYKPTGNGAIIPYASVLLAIWFIRAADLLSFATASLGKIRRIYDTPSRTVSRSEEFHFAETYPPKMVAWRSRRHSASRKVACICWSISE